MVQIHLGPLTECPCSTTVLANPADEHPLSCASRKPGPVSRWKMLAPGCSDEVASFVVALQDLYRDALLAIVEGRDLPWADVIGSVLGLPEHPGDGH